MAYRPPNAVRRVVNAKTEKPRQKTFVNELLGDANYDVMMYVFNDILKPAAKSMISEALVNAVQMVIFGGSDTNRINRGGSSRVPYGRFYKEENRTTDIRRFQGRGKRVETIYLDTHGDALAVLESIEAHIYQYEVMSVADLYDMVGITSLDFTNNNWGWVVTTGFDCRVSSNGGWRLVVPEPVQIGD